MPYVIRHFLKDYDFICIIFGSTATIAYFDNNDAGIESFENQ
ncbi:hypothetical protein DSBG_4088 [Desulfosporosinus sp. BG]|nr:hypothetical protein DSBG_4088 [Desulfosporosinus sp. BG]